MTVLRSAFRKCANLGSGLFICCSASFYLKASKNCHFCVTSIINYERTPALLLIWFLISQICLPSYTTRSVLLMPLKSTIQQQHICAFQSHSQNASLTHNLFNFYFLSDLMLASFDCEEPNSQEKQAYHLV